MTSKPGRKPYNDQQKKAVRATISAAALTLFREEGYAAVSIRRLAKEAGCAPMTIYAHFDGKINILQHLWAVVLKDVFGEIHQNIEGQSDPHARLMSASHCFVDYWLYHPDHFRLVFMSGDITRPDVASFLANDQTVDHFRFFAKLVADALPASLNTQPKTDALITALIGIVFCANTISDFPWTDQSRLTDLMLTSLIAPATT